MKTNQTNPIPASLRHWTTYDFSGGTRIGDSYETQEGRNCLNAIARYIRKQLPECQVFVKRNYWYVSGFIMYTNGGLPQYVYLSTSDLRYNPRWAENILIRTASNMQDCYGGPNHYTTLATLREDVMALFTKS